MERCPSSEEVEIIGGILIETLVELVKQQRIEYR
jgi:hypothetical protein